MTTDPRTSFLRFVDFINSADPSIGETVIAPEAAFLTPFSPEPLRGLPGYMRILTIMRGAFSDVQWSIDRIVIEGDTVAARFELRGTHDGDFLEIPATGRTVTANASNFYRFDDGLIIDEVGQPDVLSILRQIGALPPALG